ncbi:MAG TPA: hypothetical protein VF432_15785 [Thermoanaerobaculia bacterium]
MIRKFFRKVRNLPATFRSWFHFGTKIGPWVDPPPPPPPVPVRLPRLQPRKREEAPDTAPFLRFGIDLGTSSSAVAVALYPDKRPDLMMLNVEVQQGAEPGVIPTIGSAIYIDEDDRVVMDDRWIDLYLSQRPDSRGVTYRSIKRELFEHYHLPLPARNQLRHRLTLIYEELLWLALDPAESSTVKLLAETGAVNDVVETWKAKGGLRKTINNRSVKKVATTEGFDLCICVPNALMPSDVEVLMQAATIAARSVLRKLREGDEFDAYTPVITAVREAEAVAWALPRRGEKFDGDVVIVDVGAGTTDAALVRYTRLPLGGRSHLVEYRTGAPFGGDDLDMLLLCKAWEQIEREPIHEVTPVDLLTLSRAERRQILREVRSNKEGWVRGTAGDSVSVTVEATQTADETELGARIEVRSASNVTVPLLMVASGKTERAPQLVLLTNPHGGEPYQSFLRYSILLSCAPLFRRLAGHSVEAVILTGQSSLALGIQPFVAALAGHYNVSVDPEAIRHLDPKDAREMKVVCAEGAAIYANEARRRSTSVGDIVPETFVLFQDSQYGPLMDLFPAGSRSQRDEVNAMIVVKDPEVPRHILHYYCSSRDLRPADRTHDWARKPVGSIGPGTRDRTALAFRLDLKKEHITVWANSNRQMSRTAFKQSPEIMGPEPPDHPFLRIHNRALPLTWQAMG